MALNLFLFRHGESEGNAHPEIIAGQTPLLDLSPVGFIQAHSLGERLEDEGFSPDEVYSSPAVRAMQTAITVCGYLNLPKEKIIPVDALLELHRGDWEGKARKKVYTKKAIAAFNADPWNFKAPNGESMRECEDRVYNWLNKAVIFKCYPKAERTVAIFGHGLSTKCLLRRIMNLPPSFTYRVLTENCGITQLRYEYSGNRKGWAVVKINDNAHVHNPAPNFEAVR
ncbi:MAG: histidine phosphatase family protein [Candidatus Nanoarchaeia archaeon]|nr:histidine phosphatase family protein [Candidatus Nanoarchaeia archaeon]